MEIKVGRKVTVIGNVSSHSYEIGKTYTVVSNNNGNNSHFTLKDSNGNQGNWIQPYDLRLVSLTRAEVAEEKSMLLAKVAELDSYVEFMDEIGSETYDETEHKTWAVLKEIKTAKTDAEKAKAIAKIVKG